MEEKISSWQVFWLGVNLVLSTIILIVPGILVGHSESIGWLSVVLAGAIVILLQSLIIEYSFRFSNEGIVYDLKAIFGKYIGTILVLVYLWALFYILYQATFQGVEFLVFAMPYMPEGGLWAGITIVAAYFTYTKIENIARSNGIAMLVVVIALSIIILANSGDFNFSNLRPMEWDGKGIVRGSLVAGVWFVQIPLMILVIKPYLKDKGDILRKSLYSNLFNQLFVITLVIFSVALLGVPLTKELEFPIYNMARLALGGLESLIIGAWIVGVIVKTGIYFFMFLKVIEDLFNLSNYDNLIPPLGIILVSFTWYINQITEPNLYYEVNVTSVFILIHYPLVLIILFGYLFKARN
ncbi:GerAB/ArcD/ProY family transporter [Halonatronum saccharophilum]|uniref:GerAB/ArcD/ProY family transporter n=1 Tax=Halonatronum saccharophilum TaxID=150060 RepID=UPI0004863C14|nr:GerAB/ArcD/ProY family transporter [Halonatronum saccharophilum]